MLCDAAQRKGSKPMADPTWDQIQGRWKQLKGKVHEEWGNLTDDEIEELEGRREQLVGMIQEKYGLAREEANRQIDEWARELKF
jgi:uncharacterized protein YjbJ (UPF0337 family)